MSKHYFFKVTYSGDKKILEPIPGQTDNHGDPIIPGKSIASCSKYRPLSGTIAVSDGFHYRKCRAKDGYYSTYNIRDLDSCSDKIKKEYENLINSKDIWIVKWDEEDEIAECGCSTYISIFSSKKKAEDFSKIKNGLITKHKLDSNELIEINNL